MTASPRVEEHLLIARQMVTAILHNDRPLAQQLARDAPEATLLALVCADLCAHVHAAWALSTADDDPAEPVAERIHGSWQALQRRLAQDSPYT